MKRTGSPIIKIAAATSMVVFSLGAAFAGSAAWFNSVSSLSQSADGMSITSPSGKLKSVTFHPYASKTIGSDTFATSLTFNKKEAGRIDYNWEEKTGTYVPTTQGDTRILLRDYQPLSPQQPVLVLFELDKEYDFISSEGMYIRATCEADDYLGTRTANNKPAHVLKYQYKQGDVIPSPHDDDYDERVDLTTDGLFRGVRQITRADQANPETGYFYAMSSATCFYSFALSEAEYEAMVGNGNTFTIGNGQTKLDFDSLVGSKENSAQNFVTVNNDTEVSSFDSDQTVTIYSSANGDKVKYIALFIDYSPDAIEFIYSTYLGDDTLENFYDGLLYFECDWAMEVF